MRKNNFKSYKVYVANPNGDLVFICKVGMCANAHEAKRIAKRTDEAKIKSINPNYRYFDLSAFSD